VLVIGTASYITPRLTQANQINLNTGTEPRSLSDIINFTQKSNLAESQLPPLSGNWEQALRTVNRYFGTSQVYNESCIRYNCAGGPPAPKDVETAIISPVNGALGVAVNNSTNQVYVTDGAHNVTVIDASSNAITSRIRVGPTPIGIAVDPNTGLVYVADSGSNLVSLINGATVANITVRAGPTDVAINPVTKLVYVTDQLANSTSVISETSNTVVANITSTSTCALSFPSGVGVDPNTNRVYVTNKGTNSVCVINGSTNTFLANIRVGNGPTAVAVNPATKRVYVADVMDPISSVGLVSVIDATSNSLIANITLGRFAGPSGIAVNTFNNRIYVANWALQPAPSGGSGIAGVVSVINGTSNIIINTVNVDSYSFSLFSCAAGGSSGCLGFGVGVMTTSLVFGGIPTNNLVYVADGIGGIVSVIGQRLEVREACLLASANCLVVSSTGTLPGRTPINPVKLVAVSLRSNTTKTGTQMTLTVFCDNNTPTPSQQCSAFYVDGNVWGPGQTDLSKSPFIIQNAEPYFYLQFHWWDFTNSKIVAWGTWWYGTASNPNWYWGVYWWWRTYVNYYIGIWLSWWWWSWHWMYWRYWAWWGTAFQT
jgi:YVTN family beta-propeller protein